jgi:hypothetical protein
VHAQTEGFVELCSGAEEAQPANVNCCQTGSEERLQVGEGVSSCGVTYKR